MEALKKAIIFLLEQHLQHLLLKQASYHSTMNAFEEQAIKEVMLSGIQELRQEIKETETLLEMIKVNDKPRKM